MHSRLSPDEQRRNERILEHARWRDREVELLRAVEVRARGTKRCQLCHTNHSAAATGTGYGDVTVENHAEDCPIAALDEHRAKEPPRP